MKRTVNSLAGLVNALDDRINDQELINTSVSKSGVGWHIEHVLLTIEQITAALKRSDPSAYRWKFNFRRTLVYTINKIPRGRARAPERVQPKNEFSAASLKEHVKAVKELLNDLEALGPNNYFEHPFFGQLNVKPAIRFLGIHTKHHLKIIRDIIRK